MSEPRTVENAQPDRIAIWAVRRIVRIVEVAVAIQIEKHIHRAVAVDAVEDRRNLAAQRTDDAAIEKIVTVGWWLRDEEVECQQVRLAKNALGDFRNRLLVTNFRRVFCVSLVLPHAQDRKSP